MSHDLMFVPPDRRDEVRRRIAVIERFTKSRGRSEAERCAAELGIRTAQFYNLVRAWEANKRPERLAGSGHHKDRDLVISEPQAAFMDQVIAATPRTTPAALVRTILEIAAQEGFTLPRRDTVARYVARARPAQLPAVLKNGFDLLIDHTVVELSVASGTDVVRPLATMVVDAVHDAVVAMTLSLGHPTVAVTATAILDVLRDSLRSTTNRPSGPIVIGRTDDGADWTQLDAVLAEAGFVVKIVPGRLRKTGQVIEALLGRKPGGIVLRPMLSRAPLARRKARRIATQNPMTLEQAIEFARPRVLTSRLCGAFAHLDDVTRQRLERNLVSVSKH